MQSGELRVVTTEVDGSVSSIGLTDHLFNSRVLVLDGPVTQQSATELVKGLMVLENQDAQAPVTLLISSPGGDVYAGLALIDVMQGLSCPVNTVAVGVVASMAAVVLAAGAHRAAYPHAYVLIHQLMSGSGMAQQSDIEIAANHAAELRGVLDDLLAERSLPSAEEYHQMTERDCWCSAARALELGIVDEVLDRRE